MGGDHLVTTHLHVLWADDFGAQPRPPPPQFGVFGGWAGLAHLLLKFLLWADHFGAQPRGPPSLGFGGGQAWLISY